MKSAQSKITAIVGAQWGDEGKGKITDFFAGQSDYVVRFHGGNNAGHTVIVNNNIFKLHLIPSGVIYGSPISIIGNGVVVDPKALLNEISYLKDLLELVLVQLSIEVLLKLFMVCKVQKRTYNGLVFNYLVKRTVGVLPKTAN